MAVTRFDISEWASYVSIIEQINVQSIDLQREFLSKLADRFLSIIQSKMDNSNINFTMTYRKSLRVDKRQLRNKIPKVSLRLIPTGEEKERLPIYWLSLEFGTNPNPNVPKLRIIDWSSRKFNNSVLGAVASQQIRTVGTQPRPVLNDIFIITPNGKVTDLTSQAKSIVEQEGKIFLKKLEGIYQDMVNRKGKAITVFRGPGGRFTRGI